MAKKIIPSTTAPVSEDQSAQPTPPQAEPARSRRGLKVRTNIKAGVRPTTGGGDDGGSEEE